MITRDELANIVKKQKIQLEKELGVKRETQIRPLKKFAYILTGVRRCGKSTLLKQYFAGKSVNYILFEDINLTSFEIQDFARLDDVFTKLSNSSTYFLDEVQNVPGWEIYVRQLLDAGKGVFVTGSNATLMSKELGTRLTGRNIKQELYPFSFLEFCHMKNLQPSLKSFEKYSENGGMPEYLQTQDTRVLKSLVDDVIYKDVVVRRNIREEKVARELVLYLLSNIGKPFSYSQTQKLFGSTSINTIIDIVDALEQAYFIFVVNKFEYSLKKQSRNYKKVYVIDTGIAKHVSFRVSQDLGRFLENIVYLDLKRTSKDIYYHKNKHECDFVIKEGMKIVEAVQVCYILDDENRDREFRGLLEACQTHKLKEGLFLTYNQEDSYEQDGVTIVVKPVWKWLLEKKHL